MVTSSLPLHPQPFTSSGPFCLELEPLASCCARLPGGELPRAGVCTAERPARGDSPRARRASRPPSVRSCGENEPRLRAAESRGAGLHRLPPSGTRRRLGRGGGAALGRRRPAQGRSRPGAARAAAARPQPHAPSRQVGAKARHALRTEARAGRPSAGGSPARRRQREASDSGAARTPADGGAADARAGRSSPGPPSTPRPLGPRDAGSPRGAGPGVARTPGPCPRHLGALRRPLRPSLNRSSRARPHDPSTTPSTAGSRSSSAPRGKLRTAATSWPRSGAAGHPRQPAAATANEPRPGPRPATLPHTQRRRVARTAGPPLKSEELCRRHRPLTRA
nr:uncharacterized protein LOC111770702 [Equus caballus]